MKVNPIPGEPACIIGKTKPVLVVADLHVGIEAELREKGFIVPDQSGAIRERLLSTVKDTGASRLIVLGDVKHNVPVPARRESASVYEMFDELTQRLDVDIVVGNHDGQLDSMVPEEVRFHGPRGMTVKGVGLFHGHSWPSKAVMRCSEIVMAHNHPSVAFIDALGVSTKERCWARAAFDKGAVSERFEGVGGELVLMPAFNNLGGGTVVNDPKERMLGPLFKNRYVETGTMRVYLLDGTFLGTVEELKDEEARTG